MKVRKNKIILPYCGVVKEGNCEGIRVSHNLYTQCNNLKLEKSKYCKTCGRNEVPKYGNIKDRDECIKGKLVKKYGDVMKKIGISREEAEKEAEKQGLTIPEYEFEESKPIKIQGKERVETTDTDDEGVTRKRGRPRKVWITTSRNRNDGDELIARLIKQVMEENN